MATEKHKELAYFIKNTHNRLREESRIYGPQEAWNRHLTRTAELKNYASSMQELATTHWNSRVPESNKKTSCRIQWIKKQCNDYFFRGGKQKFDNREVEISIKMKFQDTPQKSRDNNESSEFQNTIDDYGKSNVVQSKISLLDVGSCYNPFGDDENFEVTAVDLAPYCDQVYKCDFLNVTLGTKKTLSGDDRQVLQLKYSSFDVCVFSLLLEYLPSPEQRYQCCKKAYEVLKPSGILIIITPDSKHVGANANIMKSWRFVLSMMGFMRISYEKLQHIHCISYRKCSEKEIASRWADMQNLPEDDPLFSSPEKIFIPQDFQTPTELFDNVLEKQVYVANELANGFDQLPQFE